jgi:uncharacterized protein with GYD domain
MESVDDWREAPPPRDSSTSLDVGFGLERSRSNEWGRVGSEAVGIGPLLDQQGDDMVTYVGLLSFTEKGIQGIKDTTKRSVAAREAAKKFGVNMREILWTMGKYDIVCVLEAEDEQALAAFNLATAMQGNLRSHSLRAYSADEMDKILAKLP